MPERLLAILKENLETDEFDIFVVDGPLGMSRLRHLVAIDRPELKDPPFAPSPLANNLGRRRRRVLADPP